MLRRCSCFWRVPNYLEFWRSKLTSFKGWPAFWKLAKCRYFLVGDSVNTVWGVCRIWLEKKIESDQLCFPIKQKSLRNIIDACCLLTKVFVLNDLLLGDATKVFLSWWIRPMDCRLVRYCNIGPVNPIWWVKNLFSVLNIIGKKMLLMIFFFFCVFDSSLSQHKWSIKSEGWKIWEKHRNSRRVSQTILL